jgi:hypothetical protein
MTTGSTGIRFSEQSTGYLNNRGFHVNKQALLTLSYFLRGLPSGRSLRLGALVVAGASVTSLAVSPAVLGAVAYCAAGASALAIRWHRMGSLVSLLSSPQSQ